MNSFIDISAQLPRALSIYRPLPGVDGFRQVRDPVSRLMVSVFPFASARSLAPILDGVAACYILSDQVKVYIGETKDIGQRGCQHASDPSKNFAREVHVIHGQHPFALDRSARLYLQHRLIELAEDAGLVAVCNVASAQMLPWSDEERATCEHFVADALRLLFDAGCRAFHSNFASLLPPQSTPETNARAGQQQLELDVPIVIPPDGELDLAYCGLFARGFWDDKGFVVLPGAELRNRINDSTRDNISDFRDRLAAAQAVAPIRGLKDRARLQMSMRVESAAVAAKIVTGAHVAGTKWVPYTRPTTD